MGKEKEKILLVELSGVHTQSQFFHSHHLFLGYYVLYKGNWEQTLAPLWPKPNEKDENAQKELYYFIQQMVHSHPSFTTEINEIWIMSVNEKSLIKKLLKTSNLKKLHDLPSDPKLLDMIVNAKILDNNVSPKELGTVCNDKEVHLTMTFLGPKLLLLLSKIKGVKIFYENSTYTKILLKKPQRILEINKELQKIKIRIDECIHEGK